MLIASGKLKVSFTTFIRRLQYLKLKEDKDNGKLKGNTVTFIDDCVFIHSPGKVIIYPRDGSYKRVINKSWYVDIEL